MARAILDNDLWALIEPLLLPPKPPGLTASRAQAAGQSRGTDGYPLYPPNWFAVGPATPRDGLRQRLSCWRRLRDWQAARVWDELHEVLLARLRAADQIDWSRVIVDSSSIRAMGAGQKRDPILQTPRDPVQSTTSLPKRRAFRSR